MTEKLETVAEENPAPAAAQESDRLLQKSEPATAGDKLRAAREAAGLERAALAAALKVPVQKLRALEEDRYDQLPGIAFTRGLALTICRRLGTDPAGVLALLPELPTRSLPQERLDAPFNANDLRGSSLRDGSATGVRIGWPVVLIIILLLAALAVYFLPPGLLDRFRGSAPAVVGDATATAPAASADRQPATALEAMHATEPKPETTGATVAGAAPATEPPAPGAPPAPAAVTPAAPIPASAAPTPAALGKPLVEANADGAGSVISFAASGDSWISVRTLAGAVLATRRLRAGETLDLPNVVPPFRVVVGNTHVTSVTLRGQPYDLKPFERGNVARFEVD